MKENQYSVKWERGLTPNKRPPTDQPPDLRPHNLIRAVPLPRPHKPKLRVEVRSACPRNEDLVAVLKDLQSRWRGAHVEGELVGIGLVIDAMTNTCIGFRFELVPFFRIGVERWGEMLEVGLGKEIEDSEDPELGLEFRQRRNGAFEFMLVKPGFTDRQGATGVTDTHQVVAV